MADTSYKNVYLVDMDKVINNRVHWSILGGVLPIAKKNGHALTEIKPLSERCVKKMINQYDILSNALGTKNASTIIEYLDSTGTAIVTLYPTNDIDVHKTDWTNLSQVAIDELHKIHQERAELLTNFKNNMTKHK